MFISHQLSMENPNNGRRHGRLRQLMATLTFGGLLAGCEATAASDKTKTPTPPEPAKVSLEECTVKQEQAELLACFEQLSRQNQAEIAALDAQENKLDVENAEKRAILGEVNTINEVLSKDIAEIEKRIEERVLEPER